MVFIGKFRRWKRKSLIIILGILSLVLILLMVNTNSMHQNFHIPNDYNVDYMEVPKQILNLELEKRKQHVYRQSMVRSAGNGQRHLEQRTKARFPGERVLFNPISNRGHHTSKEGNPKLRQELLKALSKFSDLGNDKKSYQGVQNVPQKPMILKTVDRNDKMQSPGDADYYENNRDINNVVIEDTSDDKDGEDYANPPFKMSYFENISNYVLTKPSFQYEEVQPTTESKHSKSQLKSSKYSMGERRHMQMRHITNNKDPDYAKPVNDLAKSREKTKLLGQSPKNSFKTTKSSAKSISKTSVVCNKKGECRTLPLPGKGQSPKHFSTESANSATKNSRPRSKMKETIPRSQKASLPKNKLKLTQFLKLKLEDDGTDDRGNRTKLKLVTIMEQRQNAQKAIRDYSNVTLFSDKRIPIIEDKVYWSRETEKLMPRGIHVAPEDVANFQSIVRKTRVKQMSQSTWSKCGRPKNHYVVLENGISMCARYRHPDDRYIQGEVISFYLGRYLGLKNVPVVVMSRVNTSAHAQWEGHDLEKARWEEGVYVALIQWISDLQIPGSSVMIPPPLLKAYEQNKVLDYRSAELPHLSSQVVMDLAQWSDLIIFDYITANYDRVVSMQDGAYRQKNPNVMHEKIRNLRRSPITGSLWLFDNESGLIDGYEYLYPRKWETASRPREFQRRMLQSICIFRKSTVDNIRRLLANNSPQEALISFATKHEPLFHKLGNMRYHRQFMTYFHERLYEVSDWIDRCKKR